MPPKSGPKANYKSPKTVLDKVAAVIIKLAQPGGCSRQAIAKGLKADYGDVKPAAVKAAVQKGITSNILVQSGQKVWVAECPPPAPAGGDTVEIQELEAGKGEEACVGSECVMSYKGQLTDGSQFDAAKRFSFTIGAGEVIKGWDQGVKGMRVGGRRKLTVPPKLGYGKRGSPPDIPPDATLVFEVKLLAVK